MLELFLLLFGIALFIAMQVESKKTDKETRDHLKEKNISYSYFSGCLTVKRRSSSNIYLLSCERHQKSSYKYNNPKLTYTSATVGGVTTGGFSKTGGNYSVKNSDTDKGEILCKYLYWTRSGDIGTVSTDTVKKIRFAKELIPAVKESNIAKYLNEDNTITLIKDNDSYAAAAVYGLGHTEAALNILATERLNNYLDFDACLEIYKWICDD